MMRSLAAIAGGYLVFGIGTVLLFWLTGQDSHEMPSMPFLVFLVACGAVLAFLGGYLAALVASQREALHGVVLAGLMAVVALASMALEWSSGSVWSEIAVVLVMAPSAALGGRIRQRAVPFRPPSA